MQKTWSKTFFLLHVLEDDIFMLLDLSMKMMPILDHSQLWEHCRGLAFWTNLLKERFLIWISIWRSFFMLSITWRYTGDIKWNRLDVHYSVIAFRPLKPQDHLINSYTIEDVLDKGKAAVVLVHVESRNTSGDVVLHNQASLFLMGEGGWGGERSSDKVINIQEPPHREPDHQDEFRHFYQCA